MATGNFRNPLYAFAAIIVALSPLGAAMAQDSAPALALTDLNLDAGYDPAQTAVLRAMQKSIEVRGKVKPGPAIELLSLRPHDKSEPYAQLDTQTLRLLLMRRHNQSEPYWRVKSQNMRVLAGHYDISFQCEGRNGFSMGNVTAELTAGRTYYAYCTSRNWRNLEAKVVEAP